MWNKPSSSAKRNTSKKLEGNVWSVISHQLLNPLFYWRQKSALTSVLSTVRLEEPLQRHNLQKQGCQPTGNGHRNSLPPSPIHSQFLQVSTQSPKWKSEPHCTRYSLSGERSPFAVDDKSAFYINWKPCWYQVRLLRNREAWKYVLKQLLMKKKCFAEVVCSCVLPPTPSHLRNPTGNPHKGYP